MSLPNLISIPESTHMSHKSENDVDRGLKGISYKKKKVNPLSLLITIQLSHKCKQLILKWTHKILL